MASVSQNNIVRSVAPKSLFESAYPVLSTSVTYNQGDLIAFDATNLVLKAVTGDGDAANILGVARQKIVSGVAASPYQGTAVDASVGISDLAGPVYGVVAFFTLKTGDAFNPGSKVYLTTTNAQTVTSTNPGSGNHIGIFQGKAVASAASGSTGNVLVGARYQLSGLQF